VRSKREQLVRKLVVYKEVCGRKLRRKGRHGKISDGRAWFQAFI
jgi:hypothetical protein